MFKSRSNYVSPKYTWVDILLNSIVLILSLYLLYANSLSQHWLVMVVMSLLLIADIATGIFQIKHQKELKSHTEN